VSTFFGVTRRPLTQIKKRPLAHSGLFESHYADPVKPPFNHIFLKDNSTTHKKNVYPQLFRFTEKKGEIPKDMPPKFTERIYQNVAFNSASSDHPL
jgi:hypothetical protein